jgi:hypothetical protein
MISDCACVFYGSIRSRLRKRFVRGGRHGRDCEEKVEKKASSVGQHGPHSLFDAVMWEESPDVCGCLDMDNWEQKGWSE